MLLAQGSSHLVSSSMVIKVDFDLTMSILTHNIFRLMVLDLERYTHILDQSFFDKYIMNAADLKIDEEKMCISLNKKITNPIILNVMCKLHSQIYHLFNSIKFENICLS